MTRQLKPWELGVVQAYATVAPVAAIVFLAVGMWIAAAEIGAAGVLGLWMWRKDGWRLSATEREPWPTLDALAHRIHLRGPVGRYLCYRADLAFGLTEKEARS